MTAGTMRLACGVVMERAARNCGNCAHSVIEQDLRSSYCLRAGTFCSSQMMGKDGICGPDLKHWSLRSDLPRVWTFWQRLRFVFQNSKRMRQ